MELLRRIRRLPFKKDVVAPRTLLETLSPHHSEDISGISKETVVVDFSSVNIAKPFHAGHLRATLSGNYIVRINEALGHNVIGINYLGDWGTQFGYVLYGHHEFGDEEQFHSEPINYMLTTYVKAYSLDAGSNNNAQHVARAREWVQKLEARDAEALRLWNMFRNASLEHLKETYKRMGVTFTKYEFESDYVDGARTLTQELLKDGIARRDETGCVNLCVNDRKIPLLKQDGSTLYLTRDAAAAVHRFENYNFDRIHYVVENGQTLHFQNLKAVLERLRHPISSWIRQHYDDDKFHVKFGHIAGLSTRQGKFTHLHDLLDDAQDHMMQRMNNSPKTRIDESSPEYLRVADQLGLGTFITQVLQRPRQKPVTFTWNSDSASIGLQYCHCRLVSLMEQAEAQGLFQDLSSIEWPHLDETAFSTLLELDPCVNTLIEHLTQFPKVVLRSYEEYESNLMVDYALRLSSLLQKNLKIVRVLDTSLSRSDSHIRLSLFSAGRMILGSSMYLIGICPLNKM